MLFIVKESGITIRLEQDYGQLKVKQNTDF